MVKSIGPSFNRSVKCQVDKMSGLHRKTFETFFLFKNIHDHSITHLNHKIWPSLEKYFWRQINFLENKLERLSKTLPLGLFQGD